MWESLALESECIYLDLSVVAIYIVDFHVPAFNIVSKVVFFRIFNLLRAYLANPLFKLSAPHFLLFLVILFLIFLTENFEPGLGLIRN